MPRGVRLDARLEMIAGIILIAGDIVVLIWPWNQPGNPTPLWMNTLFEALLFLFFYVLILEPAMDLRQRRARERQ